MRLICPNCDAQYEVAEDAIPEEGRDVQCSGCGHAWYQLSPAVLAAQEAEADLFEAPEPAPPSFPEVSLADEPLTAPVEDVVPPVPELPPTPVISSTRNIDEDALALLREEAEREVQARSREEHRLEVQGDLGLEMAGGGAAARRAAQFRNLDAQTAPAMEPVLKTNKGRDLLPDIEEINSTLRPDSDGPTRNEAAFDGAAVRSPRRGFRSGFAAMLVLAVAVVVVYVTAPRLSAAVPAMAPLLDSYVATVDALRLELDRLMQQATAWLQA